MNHHFPFVRPYLALTLVMVVWRAMNADFIGSTFCSKHLLGLQYSQIFRGQRLFSQFGNWKHLESSFNFPCDPSRKNDECSFLPADRADRRPTHAPACDLHPFVEGQKVQWANSKPDALIQLFQLWFRGLSSVTYETWGVLLMTFNEAHGPGAWSFRMTLCAKDRTESEFGIVGECFGVGDNVPFTMGIYLETQKLSASSNFRFGQAKPIFVSGTQLVCVVPS